MNKRVKELNKILKVDGRKKTDDLSKVVEELGFRVKEIEKNIEISPHPEVWLKLEFIGKDD